MTASQRNKGNREERRVVSKDSPTKRACDLISAWGFPFDVVERWIPKTRVRKDLFGLIDIVYLDTRRGAIVGVQCTDNTNHAKRRTKIVRDNASVAVAWLLCRGRIEVWSFNPTKAEPRIEDITMEMIVASRESQEQGGE